MRVASLQFAPVIGEVANNIERSLELLDNATRQGAELIVLPELASSGYLFESRHEAFGLAEEVPRGPASRAWAEFARSSGVYVVGGLAERVGNALYNSAVTFGPAGVLGVYRKAHLWADENLIFRPGDAPWPVFEAPFGRFAVAICYDAWFPEVFRNLGLRGADIVCMPFNNESVMGTGVSATEMAILLCRTAAHLNGFTLIAANRSGTERGLRFGGRSFIAGASGALVAGPAPEEGESVLLADVLPEQDRESMAWTPFNHPLMDRRPALYSSDFTLPIVSRRG